VADYFALLLAYLLVWGILATLFFSLYFGLADSYDGHPDRSELRLLKSAFWIVYLGTIAVALVVLWFSARSMRPLRFGIAAIIGSLAVTAVLSYWLLGALSFMNECAIGVWYPLESGDCGR
jgi:hypothetical protein